VGSEPFRVEAVLNGSEVKTSRERCDEEEDERPRGGEKRGDEA